MTATPIESGLAAIAEHATDELQAAKCNALLYGYSQHFRNSPYIPTAVERQIETILVNPNTMRKSRSFRLAAKVDVLADVNEHRVLIDHKTTSDAIDEPTGPYWDQLTIESQVTHYMLMLWLLGEKMDIAVWDVVRKPSIRPRKLTKAEQKSLESPSAEWFGVPISFDSPPEVEDNDLYESRLTYDCSVERPSWYFQRREVPRLDDELLEYAKELWQIAQEMVQVKRLGLHTRNAKACMLYGTPCKFLGICTGRDTPNGDSWAKKDCVHSELTLDGDGRDVLTNSRIACYLTCRRKHYYQYELGIERADRQESEALSFGTLWHKALEAYWNQLLEDSRG